MTSPLNEDSRLAAEALKSDGNQWGAIANRWHGQPAQAGAIEKVRLMRETARRLESGEVVIVPTALLRSVVDDLESGHFQNAKTLRAAIGERAP